MEDLRVHLTAGSQQTPDNAANVWVRSAQLLHTYIDVEPVAFDRNHCIDITFYYRILADAVIGICRPGGTERSRGILQTGGSPRASGSSCVHIFTRRHLHRRSRRLHAFSPIVLPPWCIGRYPVKTGRPAGWVHIDTRAVKSRWVG